MFYLQLVFLVFFIFLTIYGYVKNKRNTMLLGAICLVVATAAEPFSNGFNEGFLSSKEQAKDVNGKD
jgi:MFS-type transporter involved in bile tolerance (Atg22 family)